MNWEMDIYCDLCEGLCNVEAKNNYQIYVGVNVRCSAVPFKLSSLYQEPRKMTAHRSGFRALGSLFLWASSPPLCTPPTPLELGYLDLIKMYQGVSFGAGGSIAVFGWKNPKPCTPPEP